MLRAMLQAMAAAPSPQPDAAAAAAVSPAPQDPKEQADIASAAAAANAALDAVAFAASRSRDQEVPSGAGAESGPAHIQAAQPGRETESEAGDEAERGDAAEAIPTPLQPGVVPAAAATAGSSQGGQLPGFQQLLAAPLTSVAEVAADKGLQAQMASVLPSLQSPQPSGCALHSTEAGAAQGAEGDAASKSGEKARAQGLGTAGNGGAISAQAGAHTTEAALAASTAVPAALSPSEQPSAEGHQSVSGLPPAEGIPQPGAAQMDCGSPHQRIIGESAAMEELASMGGGGRLGALANAAAAGGNSLRDSPWGGDVSREGPQQDESLAAAISVACDERPAEISAAGNHAAMSEPANTSMTAVSNAVTEESVQELAAMRDKDEEGPEEAVSK